MSREATIERITGETEIRVRFEVDGTGEASVETGIGFFDHMLDAVARHGLFDLVVHAEGAACLMVTHSTAAAARADRVLHLTPRGIAPGPSA